MLVTAVLRTVLNLAVLLAMIALFTPEGGLAGWTALVWAMVVAGLLIIVFGVAVPLSLARHAPESLLAFSWPVLRLCHMLFKPVLVVIGVFDPLVRRLLGLPPTSGDETTLVEEEILDAVSEGEKSGQVDEAQKEMIEAVVEFPGTTVEETMTPRTDVTGIEADATIDQVKRFFAEAGHSRYPVYEGNLDNIVGILYVKDLLQYVGQTNQTEFDLRRIVRPALFVPETKMLRDMLAELRARKVHLAIVLDEYGGTAGLVTIEDIIEEIVGEIRDEHEPPAPEPTIRRVDDQTAEVDGRVHIDDVNDELDVSLPEDEDYDTVGGFVFATLGHIPEPGEAFNFQQLHFTVTAAEKTRVNRVKIEGFGRPAGDNGAYNGD